MKTTATLLLSLLCLICSDVKSQNYLWAKNIGSDLLSGQGIFSNGLATDNNGNAIITGYFDGTVDFDPGPGIANLTTAGSHDIFFAKYDANGNYLWVKRIGSTMAEICFAIDVDVSGNIWLAGYYGDTTDFDPGPGIQNLGFAGSEDAFIASYDNNGNYLSATGFGAAGLEAIYSIAVDDNGIVYVAGQFEMTVDFDPGPAVANLSVTGGPTSSELFFAKYDANGNYQWAKQINTFHNAYIAYDNSGQTYLTGTYAGNIDFDPGSGTANLISVGNEDIFFAKYDANGNYVYAHGLGNTLADKGTGIATDPWGNVYITGNFGNTIDFDPGPGTANLTSTWNGDVFFAKYDASGNYVWAKNFASDYTPFFGRHIILDNNWDVLLTGAFYGTSDFDPGAGIANLTSAGNADIFFARYDNNGNYLSAKSIGNINGNDYASSIAVSATGSILLTGIFTDSADFDPGSGSAILKTAIPYAQDVFIANYTSGPQAVHEPEPIEEFIAIYQNPAENKIQIVSKKYITIGEVEIINSLGEITGKWKLENCFSKMIRFNDRPGIYIVLIRTCQSTTYKKIIVE